ncbi:MAG: leucine-rich repeat domain-containing protein, partial [Blautia sp.]|uniref:leucine-rich repeat domain-containing protein n=1 Tax=Blautia sp. TaxID=1955243 RepID=UPI002943B090
MMKKKMAMLLAFVMIVTSIEGSAFAVRGADFGSELVQITEEAEPQAGGEEISAEGFGSEEELKNEEEMASAENLGSEESVSDNVELNGETPLFSDEDEKNDTVMEEELEATGVIFDSENDTENIIADGETELFSDSGELKYENYLYTVWEDTAKITGYVGQEVSIEIPATINGYIVTEIGRSAFSGCEFEEVRLPESLVIIGDQAFDSSKLKEIIIPKNVKNMGISDYGGESSFAECKNLETVIFEEGMEKIPICALCECKSVKNITIPESVREIAYAAFKNTGIETIKLPPLLVDIGQSSLSNCKTLKSIEIPSSVERIDRAAFAGCEFEEVRLPESLETIGTQAFDSSKLKEIIIPKNVTTMGDSYNGGKSSFAECKNLETVIFEEG